MYIAIFIQFNPHSFNSVFIFIQFNPRSFNSIPIVILFNPYSFNSIFRSIQFKICILLIQFSILVNFNFSIHSIQLLYSFNSICNSFDSEFASSERHICEVLERTVRLPSQFSNILTNQTK